MSIISYRNDATIQGKGIHFTGTLQSPGLFSAGILEKYPQNARPIKHRLPALRRKNRQGAFGCRRNRQLNGATVLLVDDVLTTAVTAEACSQALLKQGATKVYVVALARGLGRRS